MTALIVAAVLAGFPRKKAWRERVLGLAALAAAFAVPVLLWALTGTPKSNTAIAKLLPGNPYYSGDALIPAVRHNANLLVGTILNGEAWSAEFLPHGGGPLAVAGLVSVAICAWRRRAGTRGAAILVIALTMFAPCFYYTFLWNRLRYLWPFATGWIVGVACLARVAGDLTAADAPPLAHRYAALLRDCRRALRLEARVDDAGRSTVGEWHRPPASGAREVDASEFADDSARVGVNDTGAIAYFGERKTFDVVGLTTEAEAKYWIAGAASRLEHYERLTRTSPEKLPTHFIVYPEWMGLPMVLGEALHVAVVTDSTILGGQTMRAYLADWSNLGSGRDALDEWHERHCGRARRGGPRERGRPRLRALGGARWRRGGAAATPPWAGRRSSMADDRTERVSDSSCGFALALQARLLSLESDPGVVVRVLANGTDVGAFDAGEEEARADWVERSFDVPATVTTSVTAFDLQTTGGQITTFHYWCR